MKRYFCLGLCALSLSILICFFPYNTINNAYASQVLTDNYRRVTTEQTPFYANQNGTNLICYLPFSYYVKLLSDSGDFAHIEMYGEDGFPAIDGFVPSFALSMPQREVNSPYPNLSVTTANACILYGDKLLNDSLQYIFAGRTLKFLGELIQEDKERLYLVGYNDKIGYVKESDVYPFTLPLHPDPLPNQETDSQPSSKPQQSNTSNALKTGIFICLLLAGIIALLIAFRKKQPASTTTFYDENDYSGF